MLSCSPCPLTYGTPASSCWSHLTVSGGLNWSCQISIGWPGSRSPSLPTSRASWVHGRTEFLEWWFGDGGVREDVRL